MTRIVRCLANLRPNSRNNHIYASGKTYVMMNISPLNFVCPNNEKFQIEVFCPFDRITKLVDCILRYGPECIWEEITPREECADYGAEMAPGIR